MRRIYFKCKLWQRQVHSARDPDFYTKKGGFSLLLGETLERFLLAGHYTTSGRSFWKRGVWFIIMLIRHWFCSILLLLASYCWTRASSHLPLVPKVLYMKFISSSNKLGGLGVDCTSVLLLQAAQVLRSYLGHLSCSTPPIYNNNCCVCVCHLKVISPGETPCCPYIFLYDRVKRSYARLLK